MSPSENKGRPGEGAPDVRPDPDKAASEPQDNKVDDTAPESSGTSGRDTDIAILARLVLRPGEVIELRALDVPAGRSKVVASGYFNDPDLLAKAATYLDARGAKGVYMTLNPVHPELLARANNRIEERPKNTTADDQIVRRSLLLIDADPERAAGISASNEEKGLAQALVAQVREYLDSHGFPSPLYGDSGNGFHLIYRIDLPCDDAELIEQFLAGLARRFDGSGARIDRKVFNEARITKVFGTMARKGDPTPDRPHRRSAILHLPEPLEVVPAGLIESVVAELAPAEPLQKDRGSRGSPGATGNRIDIEAFLKEAGLKIAKSGPWKGDARRWVLEQCPFNPEHNDAAAFIVQFANGAIAAGCHHNHCAGKRWHDLRAIYDSILGSPSEAEAEDSKKEKTKGREKKRPPLGICDNARTALEEGAAAVARASRNKLKVLRVEAQRMAKWVNSGHIDRGEVEVVLAVAGIDAGLGDEEIATTIASGLDADSNPQFRYIPGGAGSAQMHLPSITVEGGALPKVVTQAEDALIGAKLPLFQRGNLIVRTMRAPAMTMRDVYRRAEGILMLCAVDSPYLVETLTRSANWYKLVREDLVLIDCPERVARTYLARSGHWRLRHLLGVIETPTLRPDGTLLDKPGYDEATHLWFEPGNVKFPTIHAKPTREDALLALAVLVEVIKAFPWLEESDKSAALAAVLTALIRHSLRTAPMFAFRAPKMASGKSLLADVVAMIATGRVCSVMSQGKDEDEDKKRMLAILVEGISVACIDNIDRPFGGATLCSILTQESWRERILGKTGTATVPTTTTWLATGNNIHFVGDIVTRVVPCDLDAKVEKPEEREFEVNLYDYVPKHRGQLVAAGLTILLAYRIAGSPDQKLSVFGRFEEWSGWVRATLVWLGLPDPCAGRQRLQAQDPVGTALRALLTAWHQRLGRNAHSAAAAITKASPDNPEGEARLYQAMVEVAVGQNGRPDARRLGNYLSTYERRTEAGLRIERVCERQGVVLWRVMPVDRSGSVGFEGSEGQSSQGTDANETDAAGASSAAGGSPGADAQDPAEAQDGLHRPPSGNNPPNSPNPPTRSHGGRDGSLETPFDDPEDGEEVTQWTR